MLGQPIIKWKAAEEGWPEEPHLVQKKVTLGDSTPVTVVVVNMVATL